MEGQVSSAGKAVRSAELKSRRQTCCVGPRLLAGHLGGTADPQNRSALPFFFSQSAGSPEGWSFDNKDLSTAPCSSGRSFLPCEVR